MNNHKNFKRITSNFKAVRSLFVHLIDFNKFEDLFNI